jgi:membrane protease YdiL (CAAX protease family)
MDFIKKFPVAFFLLATFVITYVIGIGIYLAFETLGIVSPWVNNFVLRFGPSLAGILTIAIVAGKEGLNDLWRRCVRWRFSPWLYLVAILVQPVILLIVLFFRGFGGEVQSINPLTAIGVFISQLLLTVFIGAGLGEELGWRGFLLPELAKRYNPFVASLFVGIAWFVWHIPAYFLDSDRAASDPILPFAVIILALSIVLTFGYYQSKESLLLPILLHGSFDAAWETMVIVLPGIVEKPGFQPAFDWMIAGLWCVLALIIVIRWGVNLGRDSA